MSSSPDAPLPIERFDYELPSELIAQSPVEPRDSSRLLVVDRAAGSFRELIFRELPTLLSPGDLLILNDTRVIPARLHAMRATGGRVELLLLSELEPGVWSALTRPARRLRAMELLAIADVTGRPTNETVLVLGRDGELTRLRFDDPSTIERHGQVPLPPYIQAPLADAERYQTVYSEASGSAAAPTAGLHFTPELLDECRHVGALTATITLHVGLDTFQPVREQDARKHPIHSEWFQVSAATLEAVREARRRHSRVIAVGTTSVRTLESTAGAVDEGIDNDISGDTRLYITPGYRFRVVDAMLTNFHLPRTSLLLLVSAFASEELVRRAYQHAIDERFRFYSFGDAMLIV